MHELSNMVYMPEGTIIERAKRNTKEPRAKEGGEREQKKKGMRAQHGLDDMLVGFSLLHPPLSHSRRIECEHPFHSYSLYTYVNLCKQRPLLRGRMISTQSRVQGDTRKGAKMRERGT